MKDKCIINSSIHMPCELLTNWQKKTIDWSMQMQNWIVCPYCGCRINVLKKQNDPWLYENAIVELIYPNGDRETVRYIGQEIKLNYCIRGTPWEFLMQDIDKINIDKHGNVTWIDKYAFIFKWITCPESLKGVGSIHRPEWTKYLPGIK